MTSRDGSFQGNISTINPNTPVGRMLRGTPQPRDPLSAEERRDGKQLLSSESCRWCGGLHARACPRVRKMSFHTDGTTVTEVEFWPENEWSDESIIWPEDLEETGAAE